MKQKDFEKCWKNSIEQFAEAEEKKCGDWQSGDGLSEESRRRIWEKIAVMEAKGTPAGTPRLRKRYIPVLAAALLLALGTAAVGGRAWILGSRDVPRETEVSTKVDNEDKEDVLLEEETMYKEIQEQLGIAPLRFGFKPEEMKLDQYTFGSNVGWANVYYLYNGNLISVKMMKQSEEAAGNVQWDGESRKLDFESKRYEIEAYCVDEEHHNYGASIAYGNGYYAIFGNFEDENEFLSILNKIYFKKV